MPNPNNTSATIRELAQELDNSEVRSKCASAELQMAQQKFDGLKIIERGHKDRLLKAMREKANA